MVDAPLRLPDWEAFYRDYRKPGYVPGFEITTKLGGGMSGQVFRARRMSIGKDYAIKFLQVDDAEVRKAVVSELEQVRWFAQIDHPNLVSIEDRGEVDGIPYLVMAFAGTETLRDKLTGAPPSGEAKDELVRAFLQCCRGLAALHERSLVHFDIKPANVFLKGGVARLGDYGLSKLVTHSRGSLSMGRGTPYYMAPEMLQRRGDHRSDVYSAGVMLYEILTGTVPFTGDSEWEVLKKHESEPPAMPSHLSPREVAILQRCLQKDPAARFQSVHDLIAAFGAPAGVVASAGAAAPLPSREPPAVAAVPGCVPPSAVVAPPPLPPPRRRRAGGVVLVVGAMLFLGWAVYVVRTMSSASASRSATATAPRPSAAPGDRTARLLASVQRDVHSAVQRGTRIEPRELDLEGMALPRDYAAYRAEVGAVARTRTWSGGLATKVERLGRPAFVAAVEALLGLDADDEEHCRRATNLQRLLAQMSAIDGLVHEPRGEPCEADVCRTLAIADGWRRVAVACADSDASWQRLLARTGKAKAER